MRDPQVDLADSVRDVLTVKGLADYLEVPEKTVYKWRTSGTGPPGFRAGKYVRYRRSDVEAWIDEQAVRKTG